MWLWAASRGKDWVAVRRSLWFKGAIPHFAVFRARGMFALKIEYVPRRLFGEPKTTEDAAILFNGHYKATLYRRVISVTADAYHQVVANVFKGVGRQLRRKE